MRLFLDTEFNEFKGPLISMALVPEDRLSPPFYESLGCENPGPIGPAIPSLPFAPTRYIRPHEPPARILNQKKRRKK